MVNVFFKKHSQKAWGAIISRSRLSKQQRSRAKPGLLPLAIQHLNIFIKKGCRE
ncbi:MAG: hypothetical protein JXR70_00575 [Spirochaetales bacterium]|nr:hypothetical protein [Spirochaetales bacterium]